MRDKDGAPRGDRATAARQIDDRERKSGYEEDGCTKKRGGLATEE